MQCQHQLPLPLLSPLSLAAPTPGLTPAWPSTWASSWLRQKSGQTCLNTCPLFRRCRYRNLFPLKLSIASTFPLNRAAALPLSLGLALLPPFRVWALAWQKHRWRITKTSWKVKEHAPGEPRGEAGCPLQGWRWKNWTPGESRQQRFHQIWLKITFTCVVQVCLSVLSPRALQLPLAASGLATNSSRWTASTWLDSHLTRCVTICLHIKLLFYIAQCTLSGARLVEKGRSEQHSNGRQGPALWENPHSPQGRLLSLEKIPKSHNWFCIESDFP